MKKIITLILTFVLCFNFSISIVNAGKYNSDSSISDIWKYMKEEGNLTVGADGLLHLSNKNKLSIFQNGNRFIETIDICNESIQKGILIANVDIVEISSVIHPEQETISYKFTHDNYVRKMPQMRSGAHGCSTQQLNLISMCANNFNTLRNYHYRMLELVLVNPQLSPFGATTGFWIKKVEPGGDWDYKVKTGFDPKDTDDWPAIDAGYYANTSSDKAESGFTDG